MVTDKLLTVVVAAERFPAKVEVAVLETIKFERVVVPRLAVFETNKVEDANNPPDELMDNKFVPLEF